MAVETFKELLFYRNCYLRFFFQFHQLILDFFYKVQNGVIMIFLKFHRVYCINVLELILYFHEGASYKYFVLYFQKLVVKINIDLRIYPQVS